MITNTIIIVLFSTVVSRQLLPYNFQKIWLVNYLRVYAWLIDKFIRMKVGNIQKKEKKRKVLYYSLGIKSLWIYSIIVIHFISLI